MNANPPSEPIHVSDRFRRTVEISIRELLQNAARDERQISLLEDEDHRRRQTLLVKKQLERAFRLIELLGKTRSTADQAA